MSEGEGGGALLIEEGPTLRLIVFGGPILGPPYSWTRPSGILTAAQCDGWRSQASHHCLPLRRAQKALCAACRVKKYNMETTRGFPIYTIYELV